jgi:uncharacterized protein (DUF302 family)
MKNPFRFWMTGGAAMILTALSGGARALGVEDRHVHTRVSRYSVEETVSRIEATALRHGLPVMARLNQGHPARAPRDPNERRLIIVLESSQGGTPVSMDDDTGPPALLLSVVVRRGQDGDTEVWYADSAFEQCPDGMTPEVQNDLADLPRVVDEALAA